MRADVLSVLAGALFIATVSCTTGPTRQEPPPVSGQPAVVHWVESAHELRQRSQFDLAAAVLERALRVEPGNAHLWHELAVVHLDWGNFAQAIQFAYKSSALTHDETLKSSNRRLVEQSEARRAGGDSWGEAASSLKLPLVK